MILLYLIVFFLVFLAFATTQENRGHKHSVLKLGGWFSFLLSAISFVAPFFVHLEADPDTVGKFLFVVVGITGIAGCVVFIAIGRSLLDHARTVAESTFSDGR